MITIYTDGSCNFKTRKGGIGGYLFTENGRETYLTKGFSDTTISRMEIRAVTESLKLILDKNQPVTIYSDSQYVVNSINKKWVFSWEKQGLETRINGDLWRELLEEWRKFKEITIIWCRGHKNIEGNEIADALASYKNFETFEHDIRE